MNISRHKGFSKMILYFSFTILRLFSFLKNNPFRSMRSASGVNKKCVRGPGEVCGGSKRSVSGVNKKWIGGQGVVLLLNVWYSAEALLLDPWCTFPWPTAHFSLNPDALLLDPWRTSPCPWRISPWPGGLIFQSSKNPTNGERKIQNYFWKRYIF